MQTESAVFMQDFMVKWEQSNRDAGRCANTPGVAKEGLVPMQRKPTPFPSKPGIKRASRPPIEVAAGVAHVPLNGGKFALIDECDVLLVEGYTWSINTNADKGQLYPAAWIPAPISAPIKLERWILGVSDSSVIVDHINGATLDDRRANLRLATRTENSRNRAPKRNGTGYKGVSRFEKRWQAMIWYEGKNHRIGLFNSREEAAVAYDVIAMERHGEFAWLNHQHFPELIPLFDKRVREVQ